MEVVGKAISGHPCSQGQSLDFIPPCAVGSVTSRALSRAHVAGSSGRSPWSLDVLTWINIQDSTICPLREQWTWDLMKLILALFPVLFEFYSDGKVSVYIPSLIQ